MEDSIRSLWFFLFSLWFNFLFVFSFYRRSLNWWFLLFCRFLRGFDRFTCLSLSWFWFRFNLFPISINLRWFLSFFFDFFPNYIFWLDWLWLFWFCLFNSPSISFWRLLFSLLLQDRLINLSFGWFGLLSRLFINRLSFSAISIDLWWLN